MQEACKSFLPHTGQLHGPCKRESGSARVSCMDRVRGFGSARVSSTGRVHEACALIFRVAWGVLLNTDCVVRLASTSHRWFSTGRVCDFWSAQSVFSVQHGACRLARVTLGSARVTLVLHGSSLVFARVVQFSFF